MRFVNLIIWIILYIDATFFVEESNAFHACISSRIKPCKRLPYSPISLLMKIQFFKDAYDFELSLREKLIGAVSTPLTVITLLGGVLVFLVQHYTPSWDAIALLFGVGLCAFATSVGIAVYSILRTTSGYRYECVAAGDELKKWYDSLLHYYKNDEVLADAAFDSGVIKRYVQATSVNAKNNQSKVAHLAVANRAIACAVAFAIITAVPYFVSFYTKPEKPLRVEIVG